MRLSKRSRIDTMQNEIRRRGNSWDRYIYFAIVAAFLTWVFDSFLGDYVYLRADGLVLRHRLVVATQYTAQVESLEVVEGSVVKSGQIVARLKSQEVEETLARLASEIANATTRRSASSVRLQVIQSMRPTAERGLEVAQAASAKTRNLISDRLISNRRVSEMMDSEFRFGKTVAEMMAEEEGLKRELPEIEAVLRDATQMRDRLKASYANGVIVAPADGIVGSLPVRRGSVARTGEPLMDVYTGDPYVLTYVPEGALYELAVGERVNIKIGVKTYTGFVNRIFPVSQQLPRAFQDTIRPPQRAQIVHVAFDAGQQPPTLFSKPRITTAYSTPYWLLRIAGILSPPAPPALRGAALPAGAEQSNG